MGDAPAIPGPTAAGFDVGDSSEERDDPDRQPPPRSDAHTRMSPSRRAPGVRADRDPFRQVVGVGLFEKPYEDDTQAESASGANDEDKADDEDIFIPDSFGSAPSDVYRDEAITLENGVRMSSAIPRPWCLWQESRVLFLTERADVGGISAGDIARAGGRRAAGGDLGAIACGNIAAVWLAPQGKRWPASRMRNPILARLRSRHRTP